MVHGEMENQETCTEVTIKVHTGKLVYDALIKGDDVISSLIIAKQKAINSRPQNLLKGST